jgi:type IV fimbrial biogenesis protein FimT
MTIRRKPDCVRPRIEDCMSYLSYKIAMRRMLLQRGFTLVELVITLVVAAILLAVAVPSFTTLVKNNRMTTQINGLAVSLNLARSEAVKRGVSVTVCKRNSAGNDCNNAGNWQDGWIVFVDDDMDADHAEAGVDGDGSVDAGEQILRVVPALSGGNTLAFGKNRITFDSRGFSSGYNGTFSLCDDRGASHAAGLVASNSGRVRQAVDGNGDGTVEDGSGNNITCP